MRSLDQVKAIEARCSAYAAAHAPYSEDELWELNITPDAVSFFLHAQDDLPTLLADWKVMRMLLTEANGMLKLLDRDAKRKSVTAWLAKWQALAALTPETSR